MKVIGNLTKDAIIRAAVSEGQTFTQAAGTPVDFDTVATTSSAIAFDLAIIKWLLLIRIKAMDIRVGL